MGFNEPLFWLHLLQVFGKNYKAMKKYLIVALMAVAVAGRARKATKVR